MWRFRGPWEPVDWEARGRSSKAFRDHWEVSVVRCCVCEQRLACRQGDVVRSAADVTEGQTLFVSVYAHEACSRFVSRGDEVSRSVMAVRGQWWV